MNRNNSRLTFHQSTHNSWKELLVLCYRQRAVGQICSLDRKMKIWAEEPERETKITDTGVDKSLGLIGILRKWELVWWIRFCRFANINKSRNESFPY
jgi:hypothetical protein